MTELAILKEWFIIRKDKLVTIVLAGLLSAYATVLINQVTVNADTVPSNDSVTSIKLDDSLSSAKALYISSSSNLTKQVNDSNIAEQKRQEEIRAEEERKKQEELERQKKLKEEEEQKALEELKQLEEKGKTPDSIPKIVYTSPVEGYSDYDVELLSHLVHSESGNQSYEGKLAVANVVLYRCKVKKASIEDVIYEKGQFDAVKYRSFLEEPDLESIEASKNALKGECVVSNAYMYVNRNLSNPVWAVDENLVAKIGDHWFYKAPDKSEKVLKESIKTPENTLG